jgi:two-component system, chemotaxis family, protein-glutamate methylesterase/glutaminase
MKPRAIVIGVSSGGVSALKILLPPLPADFSIPLLLVQHVGANTGGYWIEVLNKECPLDIHEAEEKEKIEPGHVYVAPPNYHMMVDSDETLALSIDERVNFARPSIDVLFETAAEVYREGLAGIVLTGANHDGAAGLKEIRESGGITIVQDPHTAVSRYMPEAAIAASTPDHILSLENIAALLMSWHTQLNRTT